MTGHSVGRILSFLKADPLNIFMAILFLPLIQEGLLSVTIESVYTKYWLTA